MADNKKSFILYCDQKGVWDKLDDEQAGRLIKHIISYVNDDNPEAPDFITELAFEPIKQSLKRDLKKYQDTKDERSRNGRLGNLKRYHNELYLKVQDKSMTLEAAENIAQGRKGSHSDSKRSPKVANLAVNDSVNVNVSDSVNDNVIKEKKEVFSFRKSMLDYGFQKNYVDEWLKIRKAKKAVNTETAFNQFVSAVEQSKVEKNELLKFIIERSWSGFRVKYLENTEFDRSEKSKSTSIDDITEKIRNELNLQ